MSDSFSFNVFVDRINCFAYTVIEYMLEVVTIFEIHSWYLEMKVKSEVPYTFVYVCIH